MPGSVKTSRTQVWFDSLGEWSWPGHAADAVEALPPAWVPAFPRLEPAAAAGAASSASLGSASRARRSAKLRPLALMLVAAALAALCTMLVIAGPQSLDPVLERPAPTPAAATAASAAAPAPLPTLAAAGHDRAGSSIDVADYHSAALGGTGSFHVYLPPGFASSAQRYPVLYLLHGNEQPATAFLQLGLQGELDTLIARHQIPPLIAVMIQGGPGDNNWRDRGSHHYESYVVEVQELIDRMLPTVAERGARAIAGDSMGGFGAMNVALGHPQRFAVVESWLGFFDGLSAQLQAARPVIQREGLKAFVYGAVSDSIANPSENAPFAAQLRAAGASARGAVYAGEHDMQTLHAHLPHMLLFAGSALAQDIGTRRLGAGQPAT
ncbi:MAG TPA: alpha/beta hydrolase-fold protein [Solirubrobacteraceae bacterium]|jgi:enterochelin esterase-like enzyme|nr:alpha/beta hydrolase-fold protein [Solirubrobacteraceae bacterium]